MVKLKPWRSSNTLNLQSRVRDFVVLTRNSTQKKYPYETCVFKNSKDSSPRVLVYLEPHSDRESAFEKHEEITIDVKRNPRKYQPRNLD